MVRAKRRRINAIAVKDFDVDGPYHLVVRDPKPDKARPGECYVMAGSPAKYIVGLTQSMSKFYISYVKACKEELETGNIRTRLSCDLNTPVSWYLAFPQVIDHVLMCWHAKRKL